MVFTHDQQELHTAFDFTTDDLYANKNGMVTPHQEIKIKKESAKLLQKKMLGIILNIGIIGGVAYFYIYKSNRSLNDLYSYLPIMIFVGALVLSIGLRYFFTRDFRARKVSSALGIIKNSSFNPQSYTPPRSRIVSINRIKFYLTPQQFDSIDPGRQYQIYYLKNSPYSVILSIERL